MDFDKECCDAILEPSYKQAQRMCENRRWQTLKNEVNRLRAEGAELRERLFAIEDRIDEIFCLGDKQEHERIKEIRRLERKPQIDLVMSNKIIPNPFASATDDEIADVKATDNDSESEGKS